MAVVTVGCALAPGARVETFWTPLRFFTAPPTVLTRSNLVIEAPAVAAPWFSTRAAITKLSPGFPVAGGAGFSKFTTRSGLANCASPGVGVRRKSPMMTGAMPRIRWIVKLTGISFSRGLEVKRAFRLDEEGQRPCQR